MNGLPFPSLNPCALNAAHAILSLSLNAQHQTGEARREWQQASDHETVRFVPACVKLIGGLPLKSLLAGVTPENIHPETDWGKPMGKEIW